MLRCGDKITHVLPFAFHLFQKRESSCISPEASQPLIVSFAQPGAWWRGGASTSRCNHCLSFVITIPIDKCVTSTICHMDES